MLTTDLWTFPGFNSVYYYNHLLCRWPTRAKAIKRCFCGRFRRLTPLANTDRHPTAQTLLKNYCDPSFHSVETQGVSLIWHGPFRLPVSHNKQNNCLMWSETASSRLRQRECRDRMFLPQVCTDVLSFICFSLLGCRIIFFPPPLLHLLLFPHTATAQGQMSANISHSYPKNVKVVDKACLSPCPAASHINLSSPTFHMITSQKVE